MSKQGAQMAAWQGRAGRAVQAGQRAAGDLRAGQHGRAVWQGSMAGPLGKGKGLLT